MGILLSKKMCSDLEACPSVFGRYTSLDNEFTIQPANFTRQYKRGTASPARSHASGRSNGHVGESPLRKRLKYDHISMDAFEKAKIYMQKEASRPPIAKTIETQKDVPSSAVKNEQAEEHIIAASMPKSNRRLSLRQLIRRRPSYRKALQTPAKLPLTKLSYVIPEKTPGSEHKIEVVDTAKTQAELCAMDTIIESLNESEYAEWEAEVSSEKTVEGKIIFENRTTELMQYNKQGSEKQPGVTTLKKKSSFKIYRRNSQRHTPYKTIKPKSAGQDLVRVEILHHASEEPEESPLVMGKLLTELKQRIAEMKERRGINSLPNLGRSGQDKRDGIQMRFISDMSVGQARIFEKLMIELKQRIAEKNLKNTADNIKNFESSSTDGMLRGLY